MRLGLEGGPTLRTVNGECGRSKAALGFEIVAANSNSYQVLLLRIGVFGFGTKAETEYARGFRALSDWNWLGWPGIKAKIVEVVVNPFEHTSPTLSSRCNPEIKKHVIHEKD